MSRTYRKRRVSFEYYYRKCFASNGGWIKDEDIPIERARYYTKTEKWYTFNLPRGFRNSVNKSRRRHDKAEIWKELNLYEYEEQCSRWNCKDNNKWGYW